MIFFLRAPLAFQSNQTKHTVMLESLSPLLTLGPQEDFPRCRNGHSRKFGAGDLFVVFLSGPMPKKEKMGSEEVRRDGGRKKQGKMKQKMKKYNAYFLERGKKRNEQTTTTQGLFTQKPRRRGRIELLPVPRSHGLKPCPSTSPTHPGQVPI